MKSFITKVTAALNLLKIKNDNLFSPFQGSKALLVLRHGSFTNRCCSFLPFPALRATFNRHAINHGSQYFINVGILKFLDLKSKLWEINTILVNSGNFWEIVFTYPKSIMSCRSKFSNLVIIRKMSTNYHSSVKSQTTWVFVMVMFHHMVIKFTEKLFYITWQYSVF